MAPSVAPAPSSWEALGSSELELDDGTRVATMGRYRVEGADLRFEFQYRKAGDPARSGVDFTAALVVEGGQVKGGASTWSLGLDGPDQVERVVSSAAGIVKVEYVQRAQSPGMRPTESRQRLCFVAGTASIRLARPEECVL